MIAVGHLILADFASLWSLATAVQSWLDSSGTLMGMGEGPRGSQLAPWASFAQQDWVQGRLFGPSGELRWRVYGPLVRVTLLMDGSEADSAQTLADLQALGFEEIQVLNLLPRDQAVYLWRIDPYQHAMCRLYLDDTAREQFSRYVRVW